MERIAARDSLAPAELAARLSAQIPLREKESQADIVIVNGGTLEELAARAKKALEEVRAFRDEA
jgi:dephospho-CoA kinase